MPAESLRKQSEIVKISSGSVSEWVGYKERRDVRMGENRISEIFTHLGPPHSKADALIIGNADTATGSMVRELFSTALWTSWDSWETQALTSAHILKLKIAAWFVSCSPLILWRRGKVQCLLCKCDWGRGRIGPDLDVPSTTKTLQTGLSPSAEILFWKTKYWKIKIKKKYP